MLISVEGASEYGSVPQQSASTRSKNLTRFNLATKIVYSGVIIYAVRLYRGRGGGVPMAISWMFTIYIKQLRRGNCMDSLFPFDLSIKISIYNSESFILIHKYRFMQLDDFNI